MTVFPCQLQWCADVELANDVFFSFFCIGFLCPERKIKTKELEVKVSRTHTNVNKGKEYTHKYIRTHTHTHRDTFDFVWTTKEESTFSASQQQQDSEFHGVVFSIFYTVNCRTSNNNKYWIMTITNAKKITPEWSNTRNFMNDFECVFLIHSSETKI